MAQLIFCDCTMYMYHTLSPGLAKSPHFVSCVESRGSLIWYNLHPGLSSKVENQEAALSPAY